jgi:DNA-binding MarR family transcriptional regulator
MRLVSNHVSGQFASRLEAHGITVSEWVILREIYSSNEDVSVQNLADVIGFTKGAVSKIIDRLEVKDLITRKSSPADGRAQILKMAPKGNKLLPLLASEADENDEAAFGFLSDKKKDDLKKILQEVAKHAGLHRYPVN